MRHLLIITLLTLSACGFQLRGDVEIPRYLHSIQVQDSRPATRITPELKRALQRHGVKVVDDAEQADAVLRLQSESFERRVQAVDANGKALEYGLRYVVVFSVLGTDGSVWLSNASASASRYLRFDTRSVLGAGSEEEQLMIEMRRDVVRSILRQLVRVTPVLAVENPAPVTDPATDPATDNAP